MSVSNGEALGDAQCACAKPCERWLSPSGPADHRPVALLVITTGHAGCRQWAFAAGVPRLSTCLGSSPRDRVSQILPCSLPWGHRPRESGFSADRFSKFRLFTTAPQLCHLVPFPGEGDEGGPEGEKACCQSAFLYDDVSQVNSATGRTR